MMIKKIISFLSAVSLSAASLMSMPSQAETVTGKLAVGTVVTKAGDYVTVPVTLEENPGIIAMKLEIKYEAPLQLSGAEDCQLLGETEFLAGGDLINNPCLIWDDIGEENHTDTGNLVNLKFAVPANIADGYYPISIASVSAIDKNLESVSFTVAGGGIQIGDSGSIMLGNVQAAPGEKFSVPVVLENNPGFSALRLAVSYDSEKLRLLGAENGSVLKGTEFLAGDKPEKNPYYLVWDDIGKADQKESGTIVMLQFEINEKASGSAKIQVAADSVFDKDLQPVYFKAGTSVVTIGTADPNAAAGAIELIGTNAEPGDTFKIPIKLTKNPGIVALRVGITYDAEQLQLVSAENGSVLGDAEFLSGDKTDKVPYYLVWDDAGKDNLTGTGTIAELTFKSIGSENAGIDLKFDSVSAFDKDLNEVKFDAKDTGITIAKETTTTTTTTTVTTTTQTTTVTTTTATTTVTTVTSPVTTLPTTTAAPDTTVSSAKPVTSAPSKTTTSAMPTTASSAEQTTTVSSGSTKPVSTTGLETTTSSAKQETTTAAPATTTAQPTTVSETVTQTTSAAESTTVITTTETVTTTASETTTSAAATTSETTTTVTTTTTKAAPEQDVDGNGILQIADAVRLAKYLAEYADEENPVPADTVLEKCDMDADGMLTMLDFKQLLKVIRNEASQYFDNDHTETL